MFQNSYCVGESGKQDAAEVNAAIEEPIHEEIHHKNVEADESTRNSDCDDSSSDSVPEVLNSS